LDETLIIGGGPAGASLAVRLAAAGRRVRLIEAQTGPHEKVCGEFLSFEAERYLGEVGVDPLALGATMVDTMALCHGARRASAALPFRALSLSRHVMDAALLSAAADAGAIVSYGRRAAGLERTGSGWCVRLVDGEVIDAARVVLATGKHDLRGWGRPPGLQPDLIGFKQHWRLAPAEAAALRGSVELHLFPGGYAGLQPTANGMANLCLVVRGAAFAAAGRSWARLLMVLAAASPALEARLRGAEPETLKPFAIASIPYGHVRRRGDGLWRLGDQAAVIPSLAGEGISIALHSGRLAAEAMLSGATADAYQQALARDVGRQVGRATWVSRALVRPWGQAAASSAAGALPALMAITAKATRMPQQALGASAVSR